ncbi:GSCOCG00011871001-RA-CDS [Cotesia congregata]|nr:GSCOCG00011871001-RA-CDS [Cotesia congregata]
MSLKRFYLLSTALRFDDTTTRDDRKKTDNLASIRDFSDQFIEQCNKNYMVGAYTTVDEM